jgi:hypothetical protein
VVALPLVAWRLLLTHDVNRRLASIRAAGLPTNGKEVNAYYAAVPDSQNAALVLTQAFGLIKRFEDDRDDAVWKLKDTLPRKGASLTPEQIGLIRSYVEMNGAALAKTEEALRLPASRYPIDCSLLADTPLPHLANLAQIGNLLQFQSVLAIQAEHHKESETAIDRILRVAHTLDEEPILISQLVRHRLLKMAVMTLERRINSRTLSENENTNLLALFTRVKATNLVARALVGERGMYATYFRLTRAEAERIRPPRKKDEESANNNSPLPYKGPWTLKLIGYYERDFGQFLYTMDKNIAIAAEPPPDNLIADRSFHQIGQKAMKGSRTLSGSIFTALASGVGHEVEALAYLRIATTALAVEQFRNRNGKLPEELEQLTPDFIAEEPEDPFDGLSLRYKRTEKGYLIYSVGPDLNDDDGWEKSDKRKSPDGKSFDLTFVVER